MEKRKKGMTMVEALVAVSLMGVVGVAVLGFLAASARQVAVVETAGDFAEQEARAQLALLRIVREGRAGAFEVRTGNWLAGSAAWEMEWPAGSGNLYRAFARPVGSGAAWTPLREYGTEGAAEIRFLRLGGGGVPYPGLARLPPAAFSLLVGDYYGMVLDCGEEPTSVSITIDAHGHVRESSVAVHRIPPAAEGFAAQLPGPAPGAAPTPEPARDPDDCVTVFTGANIWFPTGSIVFHGGRYYLALQGDRCGFQFSNPAWAPGGPGLGAVWHQLPAGWTPQDWPNCKTRDELLALFPPAAGDAARDCGEVSPQPDGMCRFCAPNGTWSWQPGAMAHGANCQAFPSQSCP